MSDGCIDDLEAAEDALAALRAVVADYCALDFPGPRNMLRASIEGAWCRPSCGAEGDPFSTACGDDTCGCPCGHVDTLEALPARVVRLHHYVEEHDTHDGWTADAIAGDRRWLLVEENVRGGWWLSTWDTMAEAAGYHAGQESASDWTATETIVDLDTGLEYEPGPARQLWIEAAP